MLVELLILAQAATATLSRDDARMLRPLADAAWGECVGEEARRLAGRTREPADTVATAAMAKCAEFERAVRETTYRIVWTLDDASERTARIVEQRRDHWRAQAVLAVIDARGS